MLQKHFSGSSNGVSGKGLALGTYPYTYARVSVMKSLLLKREEYPKLIKMDVNEIIGYLQNSQYRKEIDELGVKYKGIRLMELALNRNMANTWNKMKRISPPSLRALISVYLLRADMWNIKLLLRAKYTKTESDLPAMLLPAGFLTEQKLAELIKKETLEEVLRAISIVPFGQFAKALESFRETKSLAEIENALDKFYYATMAEFSARIPKQGRLFREFLETEIENAAMMNIMRLKRANMPAKDIQRFVTVAESSALAKKLLHAATAEEAVRVMEKSSIWKDVEEGVKDFSSTGSLVRLELGLARRMLRRAALLTHKHPLSVDVILGYLLAKEIEVRNLKLLMKVKQLGMGEEFASQQIVIV